MCRSFGHFLIYDPKADKIHIERYVRSIGQADVQKEQVAVYIDAAQEGRHAELAAADMFHVAAVALVDRVHHLADQSRVFRSQFGDLYAASSGYRMLPGLPLVHVDIEQRRLIGVNHDEGIKGPVGGDHRKVGLLAESLYGSFYPYDILHTVGLAGDNVRASQVDVFDRRGEDQVYGFAERHLQPVGYDALPSGDIAALLSVGRSREQQPQQRSRYFYFSHINKTVYRLRFFGNEQHLVSSFEGDTHGPDFLAE